MRHYLLLVLLCATACNNLAIGRACVNPTGATVTGLQISSNALECPSRLCLLQPPAPGDGGTPEGDDSKARRTCTAFCGSNDDCDAETLAACPQGFVCAVPRTAGDFCCQKMCLCKADLLVGFNASPDGGVETPFACDRNVNPDVSCKNVK